jgi:MoaA/NifB/PqqE/SkfB family radical SAM enzyme
MRREIISKYKAASCYFRSSVTSPYRKALLQITDRCNLHCAHCFISADNNGDTMPLETIRDVIIPRLKGCRVISVTLTGGEPFLHADIRVLFYFSLFNGGKPSTLKFVEKCGGYKKCISLRYALFNLCYF